MDEIYKKMIKYVFIVILIGLTIISGIYMLTDKDTTINTHTVSYLYPQSATEFSILPNGNSSAGYPILWINGSDGHWRAKLELIENTEFCITTCYAIINVTLFENSTLPTGFNFFETSRNRYKDLSFNVYTPSIDKKDVITPVYNTVCKPFANANLSINNNCTKVQNGTSTKEVITYDYLKYKSESKPIGNYIIKIESKMDEQFTKVDWAFSFMNVSADEIRQYWATWTSGFNTGIAGYWNFSETSGTSYYDSILGTGMTLADSHVQGIIGNAYNFTSTAIGDTKLNGFTQTTVNFWLRYQKNYYPLGNDDAGGHNGDWRIVSEPTPKVTLYIRDGTSEKTILVNTPNTNWEMFTVTFNSTTAQLYHNGTFINKVALDSFVPRTDQNITVGLASLTPYYQYIDELGIWNRTLSASEISDLYNGGVGITYTPTAPSPYLMQVSLLNPANAYKSNNTFVNFNWTINVLNTTISNWTLFVWYSNNTLAHQHQSASLSETANFTVNHNDTLFTDSSYIWNVQTCGTYGNSTTTCVIAVSNRTFQIHTTAPTFVLNSLNNVSTLSLPVNATFNVTTSDPELSVCWYGTSQNATLTTYTCNTTKIVLFTSGGAKTITVYANDTFGNLNSSTYSFNIYDFNVTQYKNTDPIAEGSQSIIYLKVNSTSFPIDSASASIRFNNTVYSPTTITADTNTYLFQYSFPVAVGMGNSSGILYYFNWTYNTTQLTTRTAPTLSQTIISFGIDDCSVYTVIIANLSIKDEEGNNYLYAENTTATKLEIETLSTSSTYSDVTWSYSKSWTNVSSVVLCVPSGVLNSSNFTLEMTAGFEGTDHVREFWYLDNGTLANGQYPFNSYTPVNISLMDLLMTDSTTFLFEFTDVDGLDVPDAIVHVYRKYIGEGVFREVERSRQDNNGQTHVHLVEEDVIYYFIISEDGRIIYTSATYNAKCLSSPCEISLTASPTVTNWSIIDNQGGLFAVTSNRNTRIVTTSFNLDSIELVNVSLYQLSNGVVSLVNKSSLTATAGSISLHVPLSYGNKTYFIAIYKGNEFVRSQWINLKESGKDYFGTTGAILGGLIVLAIMLMAVTEGVGFIIFTCFALLIVGIMQLVELSWLALISIICAGGIIIFKLVGRRQHKQ